MRYKQLLLLLMLGYSVFSSAQNALTEDGRTVTLHNDHTWSYQKQEATNIDGFRGVNWGATKEEVLKVEKASPALQDERVVAFKDSLDGINVHAGYIFTENKLTRGKYVVLDSHTNKNKYIDDFDKLNKILTEKYGKPLKANEYWQSDLYKNSPQDYGLAVSIGHMSRYYSWASGDTKIILALSGDNYDTNVSIEYLSKKLKGLERSVNSKKVQSKL